MRPSFLQKIAKTKKPGTPVCCVRNMDESLHQCPEPPTTTTTSQQRPTTKGAQQPVTQAAHPGSTPLDPHQLRRRETRTPNQRAMHRDRAVGLQEGPQDCTTQGGRSSEREGKRAKPERTSRISPLSLLSMSNCSTYPGPLPPRPQPRANT